MSRKDMSLLTKFRFLHYCFAALVICSLILFLYISGFLPVKPAWRYTQVVEMPEIPNNVELRQLSYKQLADLYHRYINMPQILCQRIVRIGQLRDGGWELCEDPQFRPTSPCLVYSFGINNDFSFDDHMATRYNCDVYSFDPSLKMVEGKRGPRQWFNRSGLSDRTEMLRTGWQLYTLKDLRAKIGHTDKKIDVLKIDVEKYEWHALIQMFESGALNSVQQVLVEFHIAMVGEPDKLEYLKGLGVLKLMYSHGFRIYYTHRNLWCRYLSIFPDIDNIGCHEVSFVYIPLVKS